jgi:group I intron endonuclease
MKSGIYYIECLVNNKKYIGGCKNLNRRKTIHFSLLRNNKHRNKELQSDFNLYGEDFFKFVVEKYLPCNSDKDIILMTEEENNAMNKYKTYIPIYGIQFGYNHNKATIQSNSVRNKLSIKYIGKGNPMYGIEKSENLKNKVRGSSLEEAKEIKKLLLEFKSVKEISEITGKSTKLIGKIRRGKYWCSEQLKGGFTQWTNGSTNNMKLTLNDCFKIKDLLLKNTKEIISHKCKRIAKLFNVSESVIKSITYCTHKFSSQLGGGLKDWK